MGPFVGQLHSQTYPAELPHPPDALDALESFVARSRSAVLITRVVFGAAITVGLAWLASRVESPIGVGLCGLVVIAPVMWMVTGLGLPVLLLSRDPRLRREGLSLHTGVPISFDETGLSAGTFRFPWSAVDRPREDRGGIVVRGVDRSQRRVFQLILAAPNFETDAARTEALGWIDRQRQNP